MRRSLMMANTVAVVVPLLEQVKHVHKHAGWLEFVSRGAIDAVRAQGLNALSVNVRQLESGGVEQLVADQPKGLVIPETPADRGAAQRLVAAAGRGGLSVTVYGDGEGLEQVDRVVSDHECGAGALTRWLMQQGRKRLLCVFPRGAETLYWVQRRIAGYEKAMREGGLQPLPPLWIPMVPENAGSEQVFRDGAHQMAGYLVPWLTGAEPIDGLLAVSDREAYTMATACRMFGKLPHRDIGLVGYDNYWEDCEAEQKFEPAGPQATMDKKNELLGQQLVKLLLARIGGELPTEPQCVKVAPELVLTNDAKRTSDSESRMSAMT